MSEAVLARAVARRSSASLFRLLPCHGDQKVCCRRSVVVENNGQVGQSSSQDPMQCMRVADFINFYLSMAVAPRATIGFVDSLDMPQRKPCVLSSTRPTCR